MEFEWIVAVSFWGTMAFYLAQAAMSVKEGTFSLGQLLEKKTTVNFHGKYRWQHLPMSFLNNWTVSVGDLLVFPAVNALVAPYLLSMAGWEWKYPVFFFIGIAASVIVHRIWWGHDENLGHVFKSWNRGRGKEGGRPAFWVRDLTKAGWVHFWFMALQVAIMLAYIFTPMPKAVVLWVSGLLAVFFVIQNVQAVMIQKGYAPKIFFIAVAEFSAIWTVALAKLLIAAGHVIMI